MRAGETALNLLGLSNYISEGFAVRRIKKLRSRRGMVIAPLKNQVIKLIKKIKVQTKM
jgi:hypothetical protein